MRRFPGLSTLSDRSLSSIFWLFSDKVVRALIGLGVGVWVARVLGPGDYGILNYVLSIVGIFSFFTTLGLEGIIPNRILTFKSPSDESRILTTAIGLRLIGAVLSFVCVVIYFVCFGSDAIQRSRDVMILFLWVSAANLFQAFDTLKAHFEVQVRSQVVVKAFLAAFFIANAGKIYCVLFDPRVSAFSFLVFVEAFFCAVFIFWSYQQNRESSAKLTFSLKEAKALLRESWPLMFSSLAVILYMRVDSVMIGQWLGATQVGIYGAALKLSEAWYFLPSVFVTTFFPRLFEVFHTDQKIFREKFTKLLCALFWIGLALSVVSTFLSDFIIAILYGDDFQGSGSILAVHIWTSIFVFWGVASSQWFIVNRLNSFLFLRTVWGLLINVALNFILIPKMGPLGAAIATLVGQAFATFLSDFFHPKTRILFWMKLKSIGGVS